MNSKERVFATINHQEPDRVPVGEWGIDHDHVEKIIGHPTFWRNRKETTLALWDNRRDEVVESLKNDCVELVEKLDYDIITVGLVPPKNHHVSDPPKKIGDGVWQDSKGELYKYAASNDSITKMTHPEEKEEITKEELDVIYNNASIIDESCFELVEFIGEKYGHEKVILFRDIDVVDFLNGPFGGDYNHNIMLSLICPDEVKKLYDSCVLYNKTLLEYCKKYHVSIAMHGHDLAMNTGTIMSPSCIRDVYLPAFKQVNEEIVKANMIPFFHGCGNIWSILDDFVAIGYKGYQSIQESAGMDNATMKEKYGKDLTLWTGVQCETLVSGTMEDTVKEVEKNLKILMPGGGFIFGSTNSVQFGANTDNYLKALEVVREKGFY